MIIKINEMIKLIKKKKQTDKTSTVKGMSGSDESSSESASPKLCHKEMRSNGSQYVESTIAYDTLKTIERYDLMSHYKC